MLHSLIVQFFKCIRLTLLFILSLSLQGCLNAAMTGMQAFYNRHSIQQNLSDQYITMQAYQAFKVNHDHFKDTNISVATYNNEVLLSGQTPHIWQKIEAERIVKRIPEVEQIYDTITIAGPSSTLTKMSDIWITTKVKAKLL